MVVNKRKKEKKKSASRVGFQKIFFFFTHVVNVITVTQKAVLFCVLPDQHVFPNHHLQTYDTASVNDITNQEGQSQDVYIPTSPIQIPHSFILFQNDNEFPF